MNLKKINELALKLSHYILTKKNYNLINIEGLDGERWFENLDEEFPLIRIIDKNIFNEEQLNNNMKICMNMKQIIKKKLLLKDAKVLSIYLNINEDLKLNKSENEKDFLNVYLSKPKDLEKSALVQIFPDIVDETKFKSRGNKLLKNILDDIYSNKKEKYESLAKESIKNNYHLSKYLIISIIIGYILTAILVVSENINIIQALSRLGAMDSNVIKGFHFQNLILSNFLHGGLVHLFINAYSLSIIGPLVEQFFGSKKMLQIYFLSGISANILSSITLPQGIISIGASGAIFGLFGALTYYLYINRNYYIGVFKDQILPILLINIMIPIVVPGIDFFAHIGGMVFGICLAMIVEKRKTSKSCRIQALIFYIISNIALILTSYYIVK